MRKWRWSTLAASVYSSLPQIDLREWEANRHGSHGYAPSLYGIRPSPTSILRLSLHLAIYYPLLCRELMEKRNPILIRRQMAKIATNKRIQFSLLCDDLVPDVLAAKQKVGVLCTIEIDQLFCDGN
ncbi:hypothetical protein J6590_040086 [Homalodisca vitripennis]|nr:hypothetical protein J6590_040086 [Homalodisca vitripennis]